MSLPAQPGPRLPLVVVLVRPEGSENVGSVARLCGNFGVELRLVAPGCPIDSRPALKMAHPCEQALLTLSPAPDLAAALQDIDFALGFSGKMRAALARPPLDVARAARLLPAPPARVALVFGNERTGLAHAEADRCGRLLRLPTPGTVESFNLASSVAVALTLFAEAARVRRDDAAAEQGRSDAAARSELVDAFAAALAAARLHDDRAAQLFRPRIEELVGKMDLSPRDHALLAALLGRLARAADGGSACEKHLP